MLKHVQYHACRRVRHEDSHLLVCVQALENGNEASSGLGPAYHELTGHLSEASTQFFQHWLSLVELEEAPLQGKRAEIWKMTGKTPTVLYLCYATMLLMRC